MIVEVFVVQNVVTCDDCEVCSSIKHEEDCLQATIWAFVVQFSFVA